MREERLLKLGLPRKQKKNKPEPRSREKHSVEKQHAYPLRRTEPRLHGANGRGRRCRANGR
ncbi:hypothetical protein B296_00038507, partial [Ensete ventricosum]